jgi:hypothetical protein
MHFEELWEKSESLHKSSDLESLYTELVLKVDLYKKLGINKDAKDKMLGEILFTLTGISFKENIDVFKSLYEATQKR